MDLYHFEQQMQVLYQQFKAHDLQQKDRLDKYRNIETESAKFLSILIRTQQSQCVLEIGTSTGYSTLWLAQALQQTQGELHTLEIDTQRSQQAQQYAKDFQLHEIIQFHIIDALDFLQHTTQKFDLILLDAERDQYVKYWPYLHQMLKQKGSLLVVDNVISHATQVDDFIQQIQCDSRLLISTLNIGAGLLLVSGYSEDQHDYIDD
ncbi:MULTISPECIES: O-methyltransferase [unclassified Acinetobacter]|uniref:O-methyltransferase n=1 Tax=unclassified Acinetobacter TaxID=196816 RepID=UPI002934A7C2|nr:MULTISPECIES: class I SAM-dependent methyltransferase [unclassified Acinetobacter]WOE32031.1 class I SAM-dependent methyltransferase [Acinetobacter sp. SAAs470]WOE37499.1 class I SAM-dependent methyltransferase [Acinetobacter sp. SAAs474]